MNFNTFLPSSEEQNNLESKFGIIESKFSKDKSYDDSDSPWLWNQEPITEVPKGHKSFVYLITNKLNGKRYIGFKMFCNQRKTSVNGKLKTVETESDWKDYWSSSDILNKEIKRFGTGNYIREIMCLTVNKSVGKYVEAYLQFTRRALEKNRDLYYNGIVNLRLNQQTLNAWSEVEYPTKPLLGDLLAKEKGLE